MRLFKFFPPSDKVIRHNILKYWGISQSVTQETYYIFQTVVAPAAEALAAPAICNAAQW
jgi:hypothetical protein